jgi:putative SOS response-associated peptidase YedK
MLRWGLLPFRAADAKIAHMTINARAERVATAPALRKAWQARRCLIPASGFYEWLKTPHGKQPYLIGFRDQRPFSLGGLWESWRDRASGEKVETYTIITGQPNEVAAPIHNRMPVIVDPQDYERWLRAPEPPADLLRPYPAAEMVAYPVSRAVNKAGQESPEMVEPVADGDRRDG